MRTGGRGAETGPLADRGGGRGDANAGAAAEWVRGEAGAEAGAGAEEAPASNDAPRDKPGPPRDGELKPREGFGSAPVDTDAAPTVGAPRIGAPRKPGPAPLLGSAGRGASIVDC